MKIATYNVNGVNGRLPLLLDWLAHEAPDVVCLQELKAPQERFPRLALQEAGYEAIWHGQKSWNGVAILSRDLPLKERRRGVPGDPDNTQSRYIEADVGDYIIACLYLPNGNPAPGPKFNYKLRWFASFILHARALLEEERPVILAGDFNVMPTDLDVYAPERWRDDALFRKEVRDAYAVLMEDGWIDTLRRLYPDQRIYTFWKYWRQSFERDAGLRIDHILANSTLKTRIVAAGVDRGVRALEGSSDHAPVWVEFKEPAKKRKPKAISPRVTAARPPAKKK